MRGQFRSQLRIALCLLIAGCFLPGHAIADTGSMNCTTNLPDTHAQLAEGDQNSARHLQLSRKLAPGTGVTIDVCAAELNITGGDAFRVTVDLGNPSTGRNAGDYLQTLDLSSGEAILQLHLPKSVRAKVKIELPATVPDLQVNLARGEFSLSADRVGGERKINVGYGHVNFQGSDDTYESFQVNIGLGSLHDHRQGGENHHLIVAHSFEGTGKGEIEINVGMGSVDLQPTQGKSI